MELVPFSRDLLRFVQPWFGHPGVQQWLGGPEWPARALVEGDFPGEYRGLTALRGHTWAVVDGGVPVAMIGGEVYDRWCRYRPGPIIDRIEPGPAMGLAYVVDPSLWGRGIGRTALGLVVSSPLVSDVVLFAAGIEPENVASSRCAAAAGFVPSDPAPDFEGIVYWVLSLKSRSM